MMSYILGAALVVGVVGVLIFCMSRAIDGEIIYGIAGTVIIIFILAFIMKASAEEDQQGPCIKQETSMAYNAATKTTMPYTHCVERGTWVK